MRNDMAKAPSRTRDLELDILRFVCAFTVMMYHYGFRGQAGGYLHVTYDGIGHVFRYGFLAVDLFFMISGYVILMSSLQKTAGEFLASRVSRLYPAYWTCVVLSTVLLNALYADGHHVSWRTFLANMTMIQDFLNVKRVDESYWSLTYELVFYAFVFSIGLFARGRKMFELIFQAWLGAVVLCMLFHADGTAARMLSIKGGAAYFIAGAMFYLIKTGGFSTARVLTIVACFGVLLVNPIHDFGYLARELKTPISYSVYVFCLSLFFFIFFMIAIRSVVSSRLAVVVTALGGMTYPLYLLHANVGWALIDRISRHVDKYVAFACVVTGMLFVSYMIHVHVEKRFCKPLHTGIREIIRKMSLPVLRGCAKE